jgi:hypothetical protein
MHSTISEFRDPIISLYHLNIFKINARKNKQEREIIEILLSFK